MTTKSIIIEWRNPRTKEEAEDYAETIASSDFARVFINSRKNQSSREIVDSFFHEMVHVFVAFHETRKTMTAKEEEAIADQMGKMAAIILKP